MASTPSASALSAVLRCRGNILTRNPPNKRPVTQAYSLGLAYGAARERDSTGERTAASTQPRPAASTITTTWRRFLRGELGGVSRGKAPSDAVISAPLEDKSLPGNKRYSVIKNRCRSRARTTCTPSEDTRSLVTGVKENAAVRATRTLQATTAAPGRAESSVFAAPHIYTIKCLQKELPVDVLNVSVVLPSSKENGGKMILVPLFILNGWSTLKNTCISLSILVSEMISFNLGVLSCSPDDNARERDGQGKSIAQNVSNVQQVKGQIHPLKACSDSRTKSKGNRPD